jgi:hypothetical protein
MFVLGEKSVKFGGMLLFYFKTQGCLLLIFVVKVFCMILKELPVKGKKTIYFF